MTINAIPQAVTAKQPKYVSVTFDDVEQNNNYSPRNIQIPIGARIEGNTVEYRVNKDGNVVMTDKTTGTKTEVADKTIKLTKYQLAAIEEFANIDDDPSNLTPDELINCGKILDDGIAKKLEERKSEYHLMKKTEGASAGDVPVGEACFIPVSEKQDCVYDNSVKRYIFVDLRNCLQ